MRRQKRRDLDGLFLRFRFVLALLAMHARQEIIFNPI